MLNSVLVVVSDDGVISAKRKGANTEIVKRLQTIKHDKFSVGINGLSLMH